jgi:hypothetical protein
LHVARPDQVHRDVERAVLAHQRIGVGIDGLFVERVDLVAPSRANARATAPPTLPPPP